MAQLNTTNFTNEKDKESRFVFMSNAIFAHDLIIEGKQDKAREIFPDAYNFALDNKEMQPRQFNDAVASLVNN